MKSTSKKYLFYIALYMLNYIIFKPTIIFSHSDQEIVSYILKVDFPKSIEKIPELCAYYRGYKINFDRDICLIRQAIPSNQFILVITSEVNHKSEGNNIKYLERIESKPCKVFYITSKIDKNNISKWSFEEENIENLPLRIPEGSLVLLMDPNYIDCLKNYEEQEISKNSYGTIITLPKIIIKKNAQANEINSSMNYIWLAAFDSNAIHTNVKRASKENAKVIVSMKLLER